MDSIRTSAELLGLLKLWPNVAWKVQLQCQELNNVDINPRVYMNRVGSVIVVPSPGFIAGTYARQYSNKWRKQLYVPPKPFRLVDDLFLFEAELRALSRRSGGFCVYDVVYDRSIAARIEADPKADTDLGLRQGYIHFYMPLECHKSLKAYFGRA